MLHRGEPDFLDDGRPDFVRNILGKPAKTLEHGGLQSRSTSSALTLIFLINCSSCNLGAWSSP